MFPFLTLFWSRDSCNWSMSKDDHFPTISFVQWVFLYSVRSLLTHPVYPCKCQGYQSLSSGMPKDIDWRLTVLATKIQSQTLNSCADFFSNVLPTLWFNDARTIPLRHFGPLEHYRLLAWNNFCEMFL